MNIERRGDVIIIDKVESGAVIRLERHRNNQLLIGLAARDEFGVMQIQSVMLDLDMLNELPILEEQD